MTPILAVDAWAFLEVALPGPRASEVEDVLRGADRLFTSREIASETFGFIASRQRSSEAAWLWWTGLAETGLVVMESPFEEILRFIAADGRDGNLTFADYSLALLAKRAGIVNVATADRGFRLLGLNPLFAA